MPSQQVFPITELAEKIGLSGEIRTWFMQSAGLHPNFPRVIKDGVLHADLEQALAWFEDQGLEHILVHSGYLDEDQEDQEDDQLEETTDVVEEDPPRRLRRRR